MKQLIIYICACFIIFINCKSTSDNSDLPILSFTLNSEGEKEFYTIDQYSFMNQSGEHFTSKKTKGKVHTANFFFTSCPSICPRTTKVQIDLAQDFKDENNFFQLSFSIDPKRDSIEKLHDYELHTGITTKKWQLLRGNDNELQKIAVALKTNFKPNADGTDFYHSSYVALIDKKQHIRGFYDLLIPKEVNLLKKEIKLLLNENSN